MSFAPTSNIYDSLTVGHTVRNSGKPRQLKISHRKRLNPLGRGKVPEVGAKHRAKAPCTAGGAGGSGRREAAGAGRRGRGTRPLRAQAPGRINTPTFGKVRREGRKNYPGFT